ncbi:MAG: DsbA family protein, partial [Gemmatimonadota bacterium]
QILARYPNEVAVVYRHFPLSTYPFSFAAAIASECAAAQNRFQAYHDLLFEQQDSIGTVSWNRFARLADVPDLELFEKCIADGSTKIRIAEDMAAAKRLEVPGTPTLVIHNELRASAIPIDTLEEWIKRIRAIPASRSNVR